VVEEDVPRRTVRGDAGGPRGLLHPRLLEAGPGARVRSEDPGREVRLGGDGSAGCFGSGNVMLVDDRG